MSGDATGLGLTMEKTPGETFYPQMIEGDVRLSFNSNATEAQASSNTVGSGDGISCGFVWTVRPLNTTDLLDWTVFPSTGLLHPGQRCVHAGPTVILGHNLGSTRRPFALPGVTAATTETSVYRASVSSRSQLTSD